MNYSISYNTILKLREFLNNQQPDLRYEDYTRDFKEGIKFTKLITQRNYLEKLRAKGEATPEVISLAKRRLSTNPMTRKRQKNEERRIMYFRIKEKNQNIMQQRKVWKKQTRKCEASIR